MKINCICDGISFPFGEATNNRIMMIGKAIITQGNIFRVFINCKRNRIPLNTHVNGVVENISFQHLNRSLKMDLPLWKNSIYYFIVGFSNTFLLIRSLSRDKENLIYLYSQGSTFNAFVSFFAKFYKIPVVQEVNEWTDEVDSNFWTSFIYKSIMFRWSKGAIVISENIFNQISKHSHRKNKNKIITIPILGDKEDWQNQSLKTEKHFVWCGLIEGYIKDVLFLIESFSLIVDKHPQYKLLICGKYKQESKEKIKALMTDLKIDNNSVVLTNYISNSQFFYYCQSATALLSPLWNDQTSVARFPTKIASFLFSGRPLITCKVGEVGKILSHNKNALFYTPGDNIGLATNMQFLISNPMIANEIGKNGRLTAEERFDYRAYGEKLNLFLSEILNTSEQKA